MTSLLVHPTSDVPSRPTKRSSPQGSLRRTPPPASSNLEETAGSRNMVGVRGNSCTSFVGVRIGWSSIARPDILQTTRLLFLLTTLLFGLQAVPGCQAKKNGNLDYRTAYACEGSQLSIACDEGHLIKLVRANYGRFSIGICNEHGNLEWSVDCTSHRSYYVINERCKNLGRCLVNVTSDVFDDPCPGTFKYLEVHYRCMLESTTTSSTTTTPSTTTTTTSTPPPIIIPLTRVFRPSTTTPTPPTTTVSISSSTPVSSTTTASVHVTPDVPVNVSPNSGQSYPEYSHPSLSTEPPVVRVTTTAKGYPNYGRTSTTDGSPLHRVHYVYQSTPWPSTDNHGSRYGAHLSNANGVQRVGQCPPVFARQVQWNWTRAGETAVNKCPGGAIGHAKWMCGSNPVRWTSDSPDLSQCTSYWVDNLKQRIEGGDSVVSIAAELAQLTRTKALHGGDVLKTSDMLNHIVSKMTEKLQDFNDEIQRHKVVQELLESVLHVCSNVLDETQYQAWLDLPRARQRAVASGLLEGLERSSWLVASSQHNRYHFSRALGNVLVSVRLLEAWAVSEVSFPVAEDTNGTSWTRMEDSLVLPAQAALGSSSDGVVKVVFMAFNKIHDFLGYHGHLDGGPFQSGRGDTDGVNNSTFIVNSRVLSASVNGYHVVRLLEPVIVTLRHLQEDNVSSPQCVFWDINARSWSSSGCWVRGFNVTHTTCACNHLTNFALVMELSASRVKNPMLLTLHLVTTVGCAIAIVFLLLTALVLLLCRGVKGDRATIHKHLVVCLLLAEAVYLAGIHQTSTPVICSVVAGLLHYLLTVVFAWLLAECFDLYATVSELFPIEKERVRWYALLSYSVPAGIVAISSAIDPTSYGTPNYCWINVGNYYVFSFVGPAMMAILASLFLLLLTLCRTCCQPKVVNKAQAKLKTAKSWSRRSAFGLLLACGCWASALLYVHDESSSLLAYLFTAANVLQGIGFFIILCVKNEKVRKSIEKMLRGAEWVPDCMRPSKAEGVGRDSTRGRPSLYTHANGLVTMGVGAPLGNGATGPHLAQHSWSQPAWTSCQRYPANTNTNQMSATPGLPSTINNLALAEECPLQNWLPNSAYNLQNRLDSSNSATHSPSTEPASREPLSLDFSLLSSVPYLERVSTNDFDQQDNTRGRQRARQEISQNIPVRTRASDASLASFGSGKRRKLQEHIYEVVDDEENANAEVAQRLANASQRGGSANRGVALFDPRANWERRSLGHSSSENAKLFTSLSAVFSGSPRGRHLALLREGCFRSPSRAAYSGVPSSTDSERSSSSLMVDRGSSSPSTDSRDVQDCPAAFRDADMTPRETGTNQGDEASEYPRSMPNLQGNPELVMFSNVLKYPSANTLARATDSNISLKVVT